MDPLFADGVDLAVVLIVVLKVLVTFVFLLVSVLMMIWFERKIISDMQNRIGPNRAGPWGLLQSLADGIKIFFKEDLLPEQADAWVFRLAPYVSTVTAFAAFAVIPVGGTISIAGHDTYLQLADPPVGVLFLLAMSSIAVYGVMLAGWSSGSKYPLLGSVRATAQMVSYEAAISLSVVAVVLAAGTLSTHSIYVDQAGRGPGGILPNWNVITLGAVPFLIYLIAATAEINRPPFDLVEAEQELVGGFFTEYSSVRFALFYLAEFMNTITVSAVAVTLFFGGPSGPVFSVLPSTFWPIFWFFLKLIVFLFCYVWLRASVPRFRYDQLMDLGWKRLIPAALYWLLLIAAIQIGRDRGWSPPLVLGVGVLVGLAVMGALSLAMREPAARRRRDAVSGGESLMGYLEGFAVTLRQMFRPRVTIPYPDVKRPKPDRFHGRHVLGRYEDGMEKCIGCELCAGVCPARCIYVRGADNPPDDPVSPGERYGFVYEINYLRCIHCDLCVEACPTEAITESKLFEFSFTDRRDAIYTKTELLVDDEGRPRHLPWEDWRPGDDEHTSAWMRATSPSGVAAYEGRSAWSGELGYGVRPPEKGQTADPGDAAETATPDTTAPETTAPDTTDAG